MTKRAQVRTGSPPERPLVFVYLPSHVALKVPLVLLGRQSGWRMLDLQYFSGELPPGPPPRGAFVDFMPDDPRVAELRRRGCHVVRIGRVPLLQDRRLSTVLEDDARMGRMAAEHFAERRFRHVGFTCYDGQDGVMPLYESFRTCAERLGCSCHLLVFRRLVGKQGKLPFYQKDALHRIEMAEWLQQVPKPIGLLGFNDTHGGRMSLAAREAGLAIPSQVAVLTRGNDAAVCLSAPVPLSAIDPAVEARAAAANRLMRDLLAGRRAPKTAVLVPPAGIVVRESSDVLATTDPAVARAVRYLWDHFAENLSVDDVAEAVGASRRWLERAFHRQIGRGINAELRRRRLEICCELLRTTEDCVRDIAPRVGFRSTHYLHTCFRRAYGTSPRAYRLAEAAKNKNE